MWHPWGGIRHTGLGGNARRGRYGQETPSFLERPDDSHHHHFAGRRLYTAGGHPEFKIGVGALVYSQTLPAPTQASNHFFYVLTAIGQVEQSGIPCYTFARMYVDRTKYWSPG